MTAGSTHLATELGMLDAVAQAELVASRQVSAVELVEGAITRIEAVNGTLNAVVTERYDRARREAAAVDDQRVATSMASRPLAGVPFLLKDLGATLGGERQTSGSRALEHYVAPGDAELVRRYRAAGLIVVGKTSTPEFGNHSTTEPALFGPTHNPWALGRVPGGSSGGSAAAVAAGMVPAAHGNDGAGSIRIPASCCGLFGLKPTRGRNSWAPLAGAVSGLAVEHALTRSVRDSAALLDATCGPVPGDPYVAPAPARPYRLEVGRDPGALRVAWSAASPLGDPVDAACVRAARETAELLAALGHDVEEAAPEFDAEVMAEPLARVWAIDNFAEWASIKGKVGRDPAPDELEITTWELIEYGRRFDALGLLEALGLLAAASREIGPFFDRYAAWVTPALGQPPLPHGVLNQSYGGAVEWWRFDMCFNPWNPIANITGQPAMSVPLFWTDEGLPVGTLLTGRYGDESTLFQLGAQLEAARPWAARRPAISAV